MTTKKNPSILHDKKIEDLLCLSLENLTDQDYLLKYFPSDYRPYSSISLPSNKLLSTDQLNFFTLFGAHLTTNGLIDLPSINSSAASQETNENSSFFSSQDLADDILTYCDDINLASTFFKKKLYKDINNLKNDSYDTLTLNLIRQSLVLGNIGTHFFQQLMENYKEKLKKRNSIKESSGTNEEIIRDNDNLIINIGVINDSSLKDFEAEKSTYKKFQENDLDINSEMLYVTLNILTSFNRSPSSLIRSLKSSPTLCLNINDIEGIFFILSEHIKFPLHAQSPLNNKYYPSNTSISSSTSPFITNKSFKRFSSKESSSLKSYLLSNLPNLNEKITLKNWKNNLRYSFLTSLCFILLSLLENDGLESMIKNTFSISNPPQLSNDSSSSLSFAISLLFKVILVGEKRKEEVYFYMKKLNEIQGQNLFNPYLEQTESPSTSLASNSLSQSSSVPYNPSLTSSSSLTSLKLPTSSTSKPFPKNSKSTSNHGLLTSSSTPSLGIPFSPSPSNSLKNNNNNNNNDDDDHEEFYSKNKNNNNEIDFDDKEIVKKFEKDRKKRNYDDNNNEKVLKLIKKRKKDHEKMVKYHLKKIKRYLEGELKEIFSLSFPFVSLLNDYSKMLINYYYLKNNLYQHNSSYSSTFPSTFSASFHSSSVLASTANPNSSTVSSTVLGTTAASLDNSSSFFNPSSSSTFSSYSSSLLHPALVPWHIGMNLSGGGSIYPFPLYDSSITSSLWASNSTSSEYFPSTYTTSLYSTGQNSYGELGHEDLQERHSFTQISSLSSYQNSLYNLPSSGDNSSPSLNILSIGAGNEHSVAVDAAGSVFSIGYNDSGQCGLKRQPLSLKHWKKISFLEGIMMLNNNKEEKKVKEDEDEDNSALNLPTNISNSSTYPTLQDSLLEISSSLKFTKAFVFNGCENSFFLSSDGYLYGCGFNSKGQLGVQLADTSNNNTSSNSVSSIQPILLPSLSPGVFSRLKVLTVGCSYHHSLILTENNNLFSCGRNDYGQLGLGDLIDRKVLTRVSLPLEDLTEKNTIKVQRNPKKFKKNDKDLDYDQENEELCENLKEISPILLSCGQFHSVICSSTHHLYVTGKNDYGQLGIEGVLSVRNFVRCYLPFEKTSKHEKTTDEKEQNTSTYSFSPLQSDDYPILSSGGIAQISCGYYHTLFLTHSGQVGGFGRNDYGQLGLSFSQPKVFQPTILSSLKEKEVTLIQAGCYHSLIGCSNGFLYVFGRNNYGQLGTSDKEEKHAPYSLDLFLGKSIVEISAGFYHSLVLLNNSGGFNKNLMGLHNLNSKRIKFERASDGCYDRDQLILSCFDPLYNLEKMHNELQDYLLAKDNYEYEKEKREIEENIDDNNELNDFTFNSSSLLCIFLRNLSCFDINISLNFSGVPLISTTSSSSFTTSFSSILSLLYLSYVIVFSPVDSPIRNYIKISSNEGVSLMLKLLNTLLKTITIFSGQFSSAIELERKEFEEHYINFKKNQEEKKMNNKTNLIYQENEDEDEEDNSEFLTYYSNLFFDFSTLFKNIPQNYNQFLEDFDSIFALSESKNMMEKELYILKFLRFFLIYLFLLNNNIKKKKNDLNVEIFSSFSSSILNHHHKIFFHHPLIFYSLFSISAYCLKEKSIEIKPFEISSIDSLKILTFSLNNLLNNNHISFFNLSHISIEIMIKIFYLLLKILNHINFSFSMTFFCDNSLTSLASSLIQQYKEDLNSPHYIFIPVNLESRLLLSLLIKVLNNLLKPVASFLFYHEFFINLEFDNQISSSYFKLLTRKIFLHFFSSLSSLINIFNQFFKFSSYLNSSLSSPIFSIYDEYLIFLRKYSSSFLFLPSFLLLSLTYLRQGHDDFNISQKIEIILKDLFKLYQVESSFNLLKKSSSSCQNILSELDNIGNNTLSLSATISSNSISPSSSWYYKLLKIFLLIQLKISYQKLTHSLINDENKKEELDIEKNEQVDKVWYDFSFHNCWNFLQIPNKFFSNSFKFQLYINDFKENNSETFNSPSFSISSNQQFENHSLLLFSVSIEKDSYLIYSKEDRDKLLYHNKIKRVYDDISLYFYSFPFLSTPSNILNLSSIYSSSYSYSLRNLHTLIRQHNRQTDSTYRLIFHSKLINPAVEIVEKIELFILSAILELYPVYYSIKRRMKIFSNYVLRQIKLIYTKKNFLLSKNMNENFTWSEILSFFYFSFQFFHHFLIKFKKISQINCTHHDVLTLPFFKKNSKWRKPIFIIISIIRWKKFLKFNWKNYLEILEGLTWTSTLNFLSASISTSSAPPSPNTPLSSTSTISKSTYVELFETCFQVLKDISKYNKESESFISSIKSSISLINICSIIPNENSNITTIHSTYNSLSTSVLSSQLLILLSYLNANKNIWRNFSNYFISLENKREIFLLLSQINLFITYYLNFFTSSLPQISFSSIKSIQFVKENQLDNEVKIKDRELEKDKEKEISTPPNEPLDLSVMIPSIKIMELLYDSPFYSIGISSIISYNLLFNIMIYSIQKLVGLQFILKNEENELKIISSVIKKNSNNLIIKEYHNHLKKIIFSLFSLLNLILFNKMSLNSSFLSASSSFFFSSFMNSTLTVLKIIKNYSYNSTTLYNEENTIKKNKFIDILSSSFLTFSSTLPGIYLTSEQLTSLSASSSFSSNSSTLTKSSDYSLSIWIMFTTINSSTNSSNTPPSRFLLGKMNQLEACPLLFLTQNGKIIFYYGILSNANDKLEKEVSRATLQNYQWYHLMVVVEHKKLKLFINGTLDIQTTASTSSLKNSEANSKTFFFSGSQYSFIIGTPPPSFNQSNSSFKISYPSHGFDGLISLCRYYPRGLSPIHVRAIFDEGPPKDSTSALIMMKMSYKLSSFLKISLNSLLYIHRKELERKDDNFFISPSTFDDGNQIASMCFDGLLKEKSRRDRYVFLLLLHPLFLLKKITNIQINLNTSHHSLDLVTCVQSDIFLGYFFSLSKKKIFLAKNVEENWNISQEDNEEYEKENDVINATILYFLHSIGNNWLQYENLNSYSSESNSQSNPLPPLLGCFSKSLEEDLLEVTENSKINNENMKGNDEPYGECGYQIVKFLLNVANESPKWKNNLTLIINNIFSYYSSHFPSSSSESFSATFPLPLSLLTGAIILFIGPASGAYLGASVGSFYHQKKGEILHVSPCLNNVILLVKNNEKSSKINNYYQLLKIKMNMLYYQENSSLSFLSCILSSSYNSTSILSSLFLNYFYLLNSLSFFLPQDKLFFFLSSEFNMDWKILNTLRPIESFLFLELLKKFEFLIKEKSLLNLLICEKLSISNIFSSLFSILMRYSIRPSLIPHPMPHLLMNRSFYSIKNPPPSNLESNLRENSIPRLALPYSLRHILTLSQSSPTSYNDNSLVNSIISSQLKYDITNEFSFYQESLPFNTILWFSNMKFFASIAKNNFQFSSSKDLQSLFSPYNIISKEINANQDSISSFQFALKEYLINSNQNPLVDFHSLFSEYHKEKLLTLFMSMSNRVTAISKSLVPLIYAFSNYYLKNSLKLLKDSEDPSKPIDHICLININNFFSHYLLSPLCVCIWIMNTPSNSLLFSSTNTNWIEFKSINQYYILLKENKKLDQNNNYFYLWKKISISFISNDLSLQITKNLSMIIKSLFFNKKSENNVENRDYDNFIYNNSFLNYFSTFSSFSSTFSQYSTVDFNKLVLVNAYNWILFILSLDSNDLIQNKDSKLKEKSSLIILERVIFLFFEEFLPFINLFLMKEFEEIDLISIYNLLNFLVYSLKLFYSRLNNEEMNRNSIERNIKLNRFYWNPLNSTLDILRGKQFSILYSYSLLLLKFYGSSSPSPSYSSSPPAWASSIIQLISCIELLQRKTNLSSTEFINLLEQFHEEKKRNENVEDVQVKFIDEIQSNISSAIEKFQPDTVLINSITQNSARIDFSSSVFSFLSFISKENYIKKLYEDENYSFLFKNLIFEVSLASFNPIYFVQKDDKDEKKKDKKETEDIPYRESDSIFQTIYIGSSTKLTLPHLLPNHSYLIKIRLILHDFRSKWSEEEKFTLKNDFYFNFNSGLSHYYRSFYHPDHFLNEKNDENYEDDESKKENQCDNNEDALEKNEEKDEVRKKKNNKYDKIHDFFPHHHHGSSIKISSNGRRVRYDGNLENVNDLSDDLIIRNMISDQAPSPPSSFPSSILEDDTWRTILGSQCFNTGKIEWTIKIISTSSSYLFIGIATTDTDLDSFLGSSSTSWGYLGDLSLYNNKEKIIKNYGQVFALHDEITCILDMDYGTLSYRKNGVDFGVAFSNLTGDIYPAVGFYNIGQEIELISTSTSSITTINTSTLNSTHINAHFLYELLPYEENKTNMNEISLLNELITNYQLGKRSYSYFLMEIIEENLLSWLYLIQSPSSISVSSTSNTDSLRCLTVTNKTIYIKKDGELLRSLNLSHGERIRTPRGVSEVVGEAYNRVWFYRRRGGGDGRREGGETREGNADTNRDGIGSQYQMRMIWSASKFQIIRIRNESKKENYFVSVNKKKKRKNDLINQKINENIDKNDNKDEKNKLAEKLSSNHLYYSAPTSARNSSSVSLTSTNPVVPSSSSRLTPHLTPRSSSNLLPSSRTSPRIPLHTQSHSLQRPLLSGASSTLSSQMSINPRPSSRPTSSRPSTSRTSTSRPGSSSSSFFSLIPPEIFKDDIVEALNPIYNKIDYLLLSFITINSERQQLLYRHSNHYLYQFPTSSTNSSNSSSMYSTYSSSYSSLSIFQLYFNRERERERERSSRRGRRGSQSKLSEDKINEEERFRENNFHQHQQDFKHIDLLYEEELILNLYSLQQHIYRLFSLKLSKKILLIRISLLQVFNIYFSSYYFYFLGNELSVSFNDLPSSSSSSSVSSTSTSFTNSDEFVPEIEDYMVRINERNLNNSMISAKYVENEIDYNLMKMCDLALDYELDSSYFSTASNSTSLPTFTPRPSFSLSASTSPSAASSVLCLPISSTSTTSLPSFSLLPFSSLLVPVVKLRLFQDILKQSKTRYAKVEDDYDYPVNLPIIRVNRLKSYRKKEELEFLINDFKNYNSSCLSHFLSIQQSFLSSHSIFAQLWRQVRSFPPSRLRFSYIYPMDDGQARTFRIKFDGEGVDDYGGPYREVFQLIISELTMVYNVPDEYKKELDKNSRKNNSLFENNESLMEKVLKNEKLFSSPTNSNIRTTPYCLLPLLSPSPNWKRNEAREDHDKFIYILEACSPLPPVSLDSFFELIQYNSKELLIENIYKEFNSFDSFLLKKLKSNNELKNDEVIDNNIDMNLFKDDENYQDYDRIEINKEVHHEIEKLIAQNNIGNDEENEDEFTSFSNFSPLLKEQYHFLGQLIGIALRSKLTLELPFPSLIWKSLLGHKISPMDLEEINSSLIDQIKELIIIYNNFHQLLKNNSKDKLIYEELIKKNPFFSLNNLDFDLFTSEFSYQLKELFLQLEGITWTIQLNNNKRVNLVENGNKLPLNLYLIPLYILLVFRLKLNENYLGLKLIRHGLLSIIPSLSLQFFSPEEFSALISGSKIIDIDRLEENTEYDDDLSPNDPHIINFWTILRSFSHIERISFLKFVWARPSLPPLGVEFPQKMRILNISEPFTTPTSHDTYLPKAHTCFFSINLPKYSCPEIMAEKIRYAIFNCTEMDGDFRTTDSDIPGWDLNNDQEF